jgi:hypothetical protein
MKKKSVVEQFSLEYYGCTSFDVHIPEIEDYVWCIITLPATKFTITILKENTPFILYRKKYIPGKLQPSLPSGDYEVHLDHCDEDVDQLQTLHVTILRENIKKWNERTL